MFLEIGSIKFGPFSFIKSASNRLSKLEVIYCLIALSLREKEGERKKERERGREREKVRGV